MPKMFREWVFAAGLGVALILSGVNLFIAFVGFSGSLVIGLQYHFDTAIVVFCAFFGVLFAYELAETTWFGNPEKVFNSRWINVLAVVVGLIWLSFAILIILFSFDKGLNPIRNAYWWSFFTVAVVIILANIPKLVLRLALCFKKCRNYALEFHNEFERKA